jgi:hypothetical protein
MPTVQEALDRIWSDEGLKQRLLSTPKPVLKEFGLAIPDSVSVQIHENTPTVMNAVLPVKPAGAAALPANDPISKVIERAWSDAGYKASLLSNPKDAVAEMGVKLPQNMDLKIWENTPTVEHMVLPLNPAQSELSDADLEAVAGGGLSKGVQWSTGCGAAGAASGIAAGALAFSAVGSAIAGVAGGVAAGVSTAGGAVASGSGKC